ncbi:MAG: hypothetical protein LC798_11090 [Chloroflexi bacterium]|nr:hypothetical protein [Chloroflexota bacterium]
MPPLPLWTALPASLDGLLVRMLNVSEFPVAVAGRARCTVDLIADGAPDPHDWQLWRTGVFVAFYANHAQHWPLYLRRCSGCGAVEVRKDGMGGTVASVHRPHRRAVTRRTPGPSDALLGWYQGV